MAHVIKVITKKLLLYSLCLVLLVSHTNSTVYAIDEQFYSGNDILFYDPTTGCAENSGASLVGGDNTAKAFNFFVSKGLTPQQSAGIVGNMVEESGVLPMRQQNKPANQEVSSSQALSSGLGWGLVQWTPPSKMINPSLAAGKTNAEVDTLAYQLQFLWEQLEGTGTGAKISEKAAGDHLKQQTTIDGAARSFMLKFERPADQSETKQKHRSDLANKVFGQVGAGGGTAGTSDTPTSSGSCSQGSGDIVSIAQAELAKGVKEQPIGCDAGNPSRKGDCGPEVNKYTDNTLEYWCADFVSWVYKEAGKPFTGGSSGGWRIASVKDVRAWFEQNGTYTPNGSGVIPKAGDAYMTAGETHIGIVEKVEGDTIHAISGNTSVENYSNGVGVGKTTYKVGSSSISGFGSLK